MAKISQRLSTRRSRSSRFARRLVKLNARNVIKKSIHRSKYGSKKNLCAYRIKKKFIDECYPIKKFARCYPTSIRKREKTVKKMFASFQKQIVNQSSIIEALINECVRLNEENENKKTMEVE